MQMVWLGQGGFEFISGDYRLVVDPFISDCVPRFRRTIPFPVPLEKLAPDQVLITHDHLDHLDPEGIPQLAAAYPKCRFAGTQNSFDHLLALGIPADRVELVKLEATAPYHFGPFAVTPVFAQHSEPTAVGYVLNCEGFKIYLTGDTLFSRKLFSSATKNADLLLICINGQLGNMDCCQALISVGELRPKVALPMHIGLFAENTANPEPFVFGCGLQGVKSFALTPGQTYDLSQL